MKPKLCPIRLFFPAANPCLLQMSWEQAHNPVEPLTQYYTMGFGF